MIGTLLKELFVGLRKYISFKLGRPASSGSVPVPKATEMPPTPSPIPATQDAPPAPREEGLSGKYAQLVIWSTSHRDIQSEEFTENPVFQLWRLHKPRAHKWPHYFDAYETIFSPLRTRALRILEIGVYKGASLRLWRQYFGHPETVIVGIDIDSTCVQFDAPRDGINVRIGSQADAAFLDALKREFGPFDIIIDDGGHYSSHMIRSFDYLFADGLRDDGIYVAEDLHANYWTPFRDTRLGFVDLCKELVDLMHAHYRQVTLAEWMQESERERETLSLNVPAITRMIKEIRFFDSIVAIYKTRREFLPRILNPTAD